MLRTFELSTPRFVCEKTYESATKFGYGETKEEAELEATVPVELLGEVVSVMLFEKTYNVKTVRRRTMSEYISLAN